jgi:hypothetical protein
MDKSIEASDAVRSDAGAAGYVTYYKATGCVAGVREITNTAFEAAAIEESRADAEDPSYDTNLYLLRNIWSPDITLQRKRFTVTDVGLAPGLVPHVTTVAPYQIKAVMNGEDTAGVAASVSLLGNTTLLAEILYGAGAVMMELTSAAAVATSKSSSCPTGQWSRDPFCYACTVCQPGQKRISSCTAYQDTVCETCEHEQYSLYGLTCLQCDEPCQGGVQFEHTPCTGSTNRVCGTLRTTTPKACSSARGLALEVNDLNCIETKAIHRCDMLMADLGRNVHAPAELKRGFARAAKQWAICTMASARQAKSVHRRRAPWARHFLP